MEDCPTCGVRGRRVKPVTVNSLATVPPTDSAYRFCGSIGCTVAWYGDEGHVVDVSECRVPIGQKSTAAGRTVCYCFNFSAADIQAAHEIDAVSAVAAEITAHCKRGEDRCPETNPQGSCCLGAVRALAKHAVRAATCGCN